MIKPTSPPFVRMFVILSLVGRRVGRGVARNAGAIGALEFETTGEKSVSSEASKTSGEQASRD